MKYQIVAQHLKTGKEFRSVWNDYTEEEYQLTNDIIKKLLIEEGEYLMIKNSDKFGNQKIFFPKSIVQECVISLEFDED